MIYENVKRLCDENKISIWQLERKCCIGNGTIGKWALRGSSPRINVLQKIAAYFNTSVDALLKGN